MEFDMNGFFEAVKAERILEQEKIDEDKFWDDYARSTDSAKSERRRDIRLLPKTIQKKRSR